MLVVWDVEEFHAESIRLDPAHLPDVDAKVLLRQEHVQAPPPVDDDRLPLLSSLLDQVSLALERERLERETRQFAATRDRDKLRAALLSSITEDVRPRLTAIGSSRRTF